MHEKVVAFTFEISQSSFNAVYFKIIGNGVMHVLYSFAQGYWSKPCHSLIYRCFLLVFVVTITLLPQA